MAGDAERVPITFDAKFIDDYARRLVRDPEVAIIELVSNCSDAGANSVDITWPEQQYGDFTIRDDGTGMTYDEFVRIWNTLSYNRREHGNSLEFPADNKAGNRKLFGKNGKGRFSLFCFNDSYTVETSKGGERCVFKVERKPEQRLDPIRIEVMKREPDSKSTHETIISCEAFKKHIPVERLIKLIGSKFLADPSLTINVNGTEIELVSLDHADREEVDTPLGTIEIYTLDSGKGGRTSAPHGVAWHVNGKRVGDVGWRGPNGAYKLDARTTEAKRFTIIVVADLLADYVDADWMSLESLDEVDEVLTVVGEYIQTKLDDIFFERRQERKRQALDENREKLGDLPASSKQKIHTYVDGIQSAVRTIDQPTLNAMVKLLAELEEASTGYRLLHQLANLPAQSLDKVSEILEEWSIDDAKTVLEELEWRIRLIETLERVAGENTDELHVIHPIFDKALWILGPKYEGVGYISNKSCLTIVKEFFGEDAKVQEGSRTRPDIVAASDSDIRVLSKDGFDESNDTNGISNLLIIELKRGRSRIGKSEVRKTLDYAERIAESNKIWPGTEIEAYVLGSIVKPDARPMTSGENIEVTPRTYEQVIHLASARTYHLRDRISSRLGSNMQE